MRRIGHLPLELDAAQVEPGVGVLRIKLRRLSETPSRRRPLSLCGATAHLFRKSSRVLWRIQGSGAHRRALDIRQPVQNDRSDIRAIQRPVPAEVDGIGAESGDAGPQFTTFQRIEAPARPVPEPAPMSPPVPVRMPRADSEASGMIGRIRVSPLKIEVALAVRPCHGPRIARADALNPDVLRCRRTSSTIDLSGNEDRDRRSRIDADGG